MTFLACMKLQQGRTYATILLSLSILVPLSCGSEKTNSAEVPALTFNVVDSLLGPVYQVSKADRQLRPPRGFEPLSDSLSQLAGDRFLQVLGHNPLTEVDAFFFDGEASAGLIVSTVDDISIDSDSSGYVPRFGQALIDQYGQDAVKAGSYYIGDHTLVRNFLVTDSAFVRFHLVCLSDHPPAVELHYVVPRQEYANLVTSLESSIGSLKPIGGG